MSELFPKATVKISNWVFNGEFGKNFARVLDLQMWCFGCDIRKREGNLLIKSGFTRHRSPDQRTGSRYSKGLSDHTHMYLWGFALVISSFESGLCLRRHQQIPTFSPSLRIHDDSWSPWDIPQFSHPDSELQRFRAQTLLRICALEMQQYEDFINRVSETNYRLKCLKSKRSYKKMVGTSLFEAWGELANKLN